MAELEQTIDSREVAEMVEKEHSKLLRDIRRYVEQLTEAKIGFNEFFQESEYKDSIGRTLSCYQVTKKGCEFIAHKLTGTKGTIFTARYINRFHEMETELSTGLDRELMCYLKEKFEKQDALLADIKKQTRMRSLPVRYLNPVQGEYKANIEMMIESSTDTEYLQAVYTFAKHYPNKSVVA